MEVGTGWIGWTFEQTMDTPMWAIEAAHKGRLAMLRAIFGTSEESPPETPPLTPASFKAMFSNGDS